MAPRKGQATRARKAASSSSGGESSIASEDKKRRHARSKSDGDEQRSDAGIDNEEYDIMGGDVGILVGQIESAFETYKADIMNCALVAETKLRNDLRLSLLKMPKKIRTMPLHDFTKNFNENIKDAMMVDVDNNHDKLLLMLAEMNHDDGGGGNSKNTGIAKTIMRTARKTTRKVNRKRNADGESIDTGEGELGSMNESVPMTVTRTTRKRKHASASTAMEYNSTHYDGETVHQENDEPPTTLRRSTRTRSRTNSFNDMVTPMPTRRGVGRTPFSNVNSQVAVTPGIVPGSASRMPKKGEVFFSKNGSPLGSFLEVPGEEEAATAEDDKENEVLLKNKDGQEVNVVDSGVTLTQDLRNAAVNHLHGLQSQVAALVSKLYGQ